MDTARAFRHGSGTFRHNKKEPVTGLVPKGGVFLKREAEFSKLFRHDSGTFRHTGKNHKSLTSPQKREYGYLP
ncbi:MAG: hypothetical protein WC295_05865 [Methanoregula sp.]